MSGELHRTPEAAAKEALAERMRAEEALFAGDADLLAQQDQAFAEGIAALGGEAKIARDAEASKLAELKNNARGM